MKILHVSSVYPLNKGFGVTRHILELANAQAALEHDVHLLAWSGPDGTKDERRGGIEVHYLNEAYPFAAYNEYLQSVLTSLPLTERILEVWKVHGPFDVVALHEWTGSFAASVLQRIAGCPLITTLHGTQVGRTGGKGAREEIYVAEMEKWLSEKSDRIIVPSEFTRSEVESRYSIDTRKLAVVPGGVSAASFHADVDLEEFRGMFANPAEPLVVFSGRFAPEKGVDVLVQALGSVVKARPEVRCVLAGDGPMASWVSEQVGRGGLEKHLRSAGHLGSAVLGALYRVADLLVLPSRYEAFGGTILEAAVHGTPVLASQCGGIPELARANLPVKLRPVPPGQHHALSQGILDFLKTATRDRSGRAPRQDRVPPSYRWEDVAQRTLDVYESVFAVR